MRSIKTNNIRRDYRGFYKRATVLGILYTYLGIMMLFFFEAFSSNSSYHALNSLWTQRVWGTLYAIAGLGFLYSLNFGKNTALRAYALLSTILAAMWSIGLFIAWVTGKSGSPNGWVLYGVIGLLMYFKATDPVTVGAKNGEPRS